MKVSDVLTEVEMNMEETQNQRDARVEQLWRKLDHQQRGELDWRGLQQGLRKIDHPLKNADELLKRTTNMVDTNGDGKIQYEEFRVFVEATERQLFLLFKSIDRDNNGRLDKEELQTAFQRVGLAVPQRRLNTFFEDMDLNKDGYVSFAEWRDFLLFMPNDNHANAHTTLHTVLSFYSDVVVLNPEGDSIITEETLEGLGYYIAGAAAGGISRTATAPLDRLKVYLLVNTKSDTHAAVDAVKTGRPVDAVRNFSRSLFRAMSQLHREGGLRGFWAGNGLNVIKIMPETAIRFGTYEAAKRALAGLEGHGDTHHIHWGSKFVAGGVAGMTAQLCVYPLDTLKFRLQSEYTQDGARGRTLLAKTWQQMWAEGRWRAAYRGVTMGLVGMFPYSAFDMFTFEFLKGQYVTWKAKKSGRHEEDIQPPTWLTGVFGAFSGALGATIVYPLNVLRTRLQTQGTRMHPARYTGITDVARKTWRHEGYRGLYKGLTPNIMKVAPALSITWVVYERAKDLMNLN